MIVQTDIIEEKMINLLIVDDHPMIPNGLEAVLQGEENINTIRKVSSGKGALELIQRTLDQQNDPINFVITDIEMPEFDGLELAKEIKASYSDVKILVYSMHKKKKYLDEVIQVGVDGYVLKEEHVDIVLDAIYFISEGKTFFSKTFKDAMRENSKDGKSVKISPREQEVLKLLADGYTAREIGRILELSKNTIITVKNRLYQKTGIQGEKGLIKFAVEEGYA